MEFKNVKKLRKKHNLTQTQVANILYCKREVYRRYELGVCELPASYAKILAEYYDVTLDYLLQ